MIKKLCYLLLTILIVFSALLWVDNVLVLRRINDLMQSIDYYRNVNKQFPKSLVDLNIKLNGNNAKESYCDMFEPQLEGIGYCYYTNFQNENYAIQIYSYFHVVTFNSENNSLVKKFSLFYE